MVQCGGKEKGNLYLVCDCSAETGKNMKAYRQWKGMVINMNVFYYEVVSIDGDYANLRRTDEESDDLKLVARALLPPETAEGTQLKYEWMQYEIISG